jgi:PAS domain S-box-containing protein
VNDEINILLVEDNPGDARLLNIYLEGFFVSAFSLSTTAYLSKAFELLGEKTFSIIVLDLTLPDSSGLDTFKKVYQHSPHIPIIVLTGFEDESVGINAVKLGAQDFLVKGKVNGAELSRAINYSIERFKLLKALAENSRKLEERTLELQKEKLKLSEAQKLSHIGSWEWDVEKNVVNWSDELYRIFGLKKEEFNASFEGYMDCIHPEEKESVQKIIGGAFYGCHSFNFYHRILLPDKTVRTIHSIGEVIQDEDGNASKMVGTAQDVTERVSEEELKKLVLAATQSNNSVIIADKNGKIEWVNEGFTQLTGYTMNEVLNTYGEAMRKGSENGLSSLKESFSLLLKNKQPITYENKNISKQGKEYWVITTLTPVFAKNGELVRIIAIDSDITQRKQMEEELLTANKIAEHSLWKGNRALTELMQAKKELEESMKVKEQFLANMSHEIRTPMNAIIGFTDLILKTKLEREQQQYIAAIKTSGENLLVIINDILDFSKLQSGNITLEEIEMHLGKLVPALVEFMLPKSVEKNIKLSAKIDKNIPECLIGDPTRLNQILLNLVGNAIKFTAKGEVKITVDLLSKTNTHAIVKFSVSDTGIGISNDKLSYVFQGFTQASNSTTRKYGGTGLGLTIVKQLIELQGGSVSVMSEEGKGSVFTFQIDFKMGADQTIERIQEPDENVDDHIPDLNILLVEDNLLNQILATKVLNDWKWSVQVAENGVLALKQIDKTNFDLVLMDIQLPEMDGYEATRNIRQNADPIKSGVPIIAMTAHAMAGESEKCIHAGMDEYVSKPFDAKALYNKIITVLKKKRGRNGCT